LDSRIFPPHIFEGDSNACNLRFCHEIVLCLTGILVSGRDNTANVKLRLRDRVGIAPRFIRRSTRTLGIGKPCRTSISTKNSNPFEGVGVAPDIEVHTTAEDLRAGTDPVLAKAYALICEREGPK
jgi:hypothetical protein